MKLKYIELYGFKSFADKTKLIFNKDISAIVGPNGSGKSNIADAIKWVLGEQSAKSLRGSNMQDIIFSGTQIKKQMNMAQVSLILDNSDKSLPIAFEEVNVTRRVYRTGDSEYLINKSTVRLKDIKELFLDTGIGKDGYSMIGQGRIDEILNGRNEDRRYIFEEACGISKNKYKKNEAERKLVKNEENLSVLSSEIKIKKQENDILKKQYENAKEGIKLTARLELLELNLLKKLVDKASQDLIKDSSDLEYIEKELNEDNKKLSILLEKTKPIEESIEEKSVKLEEFKESVYESNNRIQKLDSSIEVLAEKIKFYNADIERLNLDIDNRNSRIENLNLELKSKKEKYVKLDENKVEYSKNISYFEKEISKLKISIDEEIIKIKSTKESIIKNNEILSSLKVDKSTKEKLDDSNKKLKINYISEISRLLEVINEKEGKINELNKKILSIDNEIKSYAEQITDLMSSRDNIQKNIFNIEEEISSVKNSYLRLESKKDILERQYKSYEGYYRSVQNLLKISDRNINISSKIIGVLADLIEVKDEYKLALDVALGSALQNIVIENEEDGKYLIDFLKKNNIGRITFLPINKIKGYKNDINHPKAINTLNNLVSFDSRVENIVDYFLSKTILVENMDDAIAVSREIKGYKVITFEGEVINSWGSMVGGKTFKKESNSLLNRKKEIDNINYELNELSNLGKSLNKNYDIKKKELADVVYDLTNIDSKINELNTERNHINSSINELKIEKSFNEKRKSEFDELLSSIEEELKDIDFSNIDIIRKNLEQSNEKLLHSEASYGKLQDDKSNIEKDLIKYKSEFDVIIRDLSLLENDIDNADYDIDDNSSILNKDKENLEFTIKNINNAENNISKYKEERLELEKVSNQKDDFIKNLEDELIKLKTEIKNDKLKIEQLRENISSSEKDKFKLELKIENSQSKVASLRNDYIETYSVTEDELDKKLLSLEVVEATKRELVQIKNRLSQIGYFNYESIEKYNLSTEELEFMNSQYNDLVSSRNDILNMIKKIETGMKETFRESFAEINERFNKIFNILFNGGEAEVKLDSDDILTAGIEIIARPPGKKLKSIALLSGGEKALTAVALLFAIFETNPAPFCMLDEIDAALDEANIKRYIKYLKSLVHKTQFIIITHRKVTMEMADILYGVTMQEQGISKVITLMLEEYKDL